MKRELRNKILEAKHAYGWDNIYIIWTVRYGYDDGKKRTYYRHTSKRLAKKYFEFFINTVQTTDNPINNGLTYHIYLECDIMSKDKIVDTYTEVYKTVISKF